MISKDEALDIVHICEIAAKSPIERVKMRELKEFVMLNFPEWILIDTPKEGENV